MVLPRYQQHFISTSQASKPTDVIAQLSDREFECLAKNVYFEAGNQPVVGQLAVALVTLNRVNDHRFPRTICGVISQGSMVDPNKKVGRSCQFSWYCNGKSNNPNKNSVTWQTAKQVALDAHRMFHKGIDITNGATHFHATYVKPGWAKTLERVARIDDHIFYKWNPRRL
jgi:spore germination cell wall hydrolase CwlJ-like protein